MKTEYDMVFSVRMSMDDMTCTLELRSDEPITQGMLIEALKDLAEQIASDEEEIEAMQ